MNIEAIKAGIAKFHLGYSFEDCNANELVGYSLAAYSMGFDDALSGVKPQLTPDECPDYVDGYSAFDAYPG